MTTKLKIGEMARLHGVSAQTLRYYDRIDLFKPSYTNQETGYRYYGIEQFAHLESILFLKGMGMPLENIKEYFKNRELTSMLSLLQQRITFIDNEIGRLEAKRKVIASLLAAVTGYMNEDILGKCRLQRMPRRSVLFFDFESGDAFTEHEFGIKKLENVLDNVDDLYLNPFGMVIGQAEFECGHYDRFKGIAMIFSGKDVRRPGTHLLPAGAYATMAFIGTYKDVSKACGQLGRWVREHDYQVTGDGYVLVVTDKAYSDYEYEYISEIQIPVKKRE